MGMRMAATAVVSRRFGDKKYFEAGSITFQSMLAGGVLALLTGGVAAYFARDILFLMGAGPEVVAIGLSNAHIIFAGNIAILLLFMINGAFRGAGQPHLAMRALWIANGCNLVLDPLFIFGIGTIGGMGLEGAAWATTIGRSPGVVYQLYHLLNGKHQLKILRENLVLSLSAIVKIMKLASGGMGQFLIDSVSWILLNRIIAEFESNARAGYTIAFRIIVFILLPAWGLSSAAATLVGQNLGAQKVERAERAVWLTARYNVAIMAAITLVFVLSGKHLSVFFTTDPEVIRLATEALTIITLGYFFFGLGMVMIQAFKRTREIMDWSELDAAYALAKDNGFPFRMHVLIGGNRQPAWIESLPAAEQLEEIEEWFSLVANRYPDIDFLKVVNEPLHDPPNSAGSGGGNYIAALGGAGSTGWDGVLNSFRLARKYFPDTKLMINEYNIVGDASKTRKYKAIIELFQKEELIDAIGGQGYAFSTTGASSTTTSNLNSLAETGHQSM